MEREEILAASGGFVAGGVGAKLVKKVPQIAGKTLGPVQLKDVVNVGVGAVVAVASLIWGPRYVKEAGTGFGVGMAAVSVLDTLLGNPGSPVVRTTTTVSTPQTSAQPVYY
jgi:hypothetical protein